jgi:hypothetical protein
MVLIDHILEWWSALDARPAPTITQPLSASVARHSKKTNGIL